MAAIQRGLEKIFNSELWDRIHEQCIGCGACAFLRARAGQQRETLAYPPKAVTLTNKDALWLADLKVTW